MKTLEQVGTWSLILPANKRFQVVMNDEAVLDRETGLVWQKTPRSSIPNFPLDWPTAYFQCLIMTDGGRGGWRLPSAEELTSLFVRNSQNKLTLPAGHPFQIPDLNKSYWSSTTVTHSVETMEDLSKAYTVNPANGWVQENQKAEGFLVWCVRGGRGFDHP